MSDVTYLTHITVDGDRWDTLAARYYGDARAYVQIIDANPLAPILPILPAGKTLLIPIVAADNALTADLPPWKR